MLRNGRAHGWDPASLTAVRQGTWARPIARAGDRGEVAGRARLWLGEGGMTYGGFGHDVKGRNWLRLYGGGLSYLEDLSCAAVSGANLFMRQRAFCC